MMQKSTKHKKVFFTKYHVNVWLSVKNITLRYFQNRSIESQCMGDSERRVEVPLAGRAL